MFYEKVNEHESIEPAIGIDLGTTNCCIMVYHSGKVNVVPNRTQMNSNTTPSMVCYMDDGSDSFGFVAKEEAYRYPETTIYDAKRMIGRQWNDPHLQSDRSHWPFEVVEDNNHPMIKTWNKTRQPHEVSARLLAQFRVMAEEYLELPLGSITKAVITVPAYFTEPQRRATCVAAQIAGLDVLNILSEPTAAAIAYSWERQDKDRKRRALIYDFGGGTFDVSVATVSGDMVEIHAVDGDTHLGGQDIDQLLMDYCIKEFQAEEGIDLLEGKHSSQKQDRDGVRSMLSRLKMKCEKAKDCLSSAKRTKIDVERIYKDKHLTVNITRDQFDDLIRPIIQRTIDVVDKVLEEVKSKGIKSMSDIDDVILVGGTTRIPLVGTMLSEYFGGKKLCKSIDPDRAVAYGAAIQAHMLSRPDEPHPIQVLDVTPMSLGIFLYGDVFSRIIHRNATIPCEESVVHATVYDYQTQAKVCIYQGENDKATANKYIGEFVVDGLCPKPAGDEEVKIIMKIDDNGMLHVDAVSVTTGNSRGITITSDQLSTDTTVMEKLQKEVHFLLKSYFVKKQ